MSTITLPSGVEVYEGKVLVIPGISSVMPTGDLTPAEVEALKDAVEAVLNQDLGELANVTEAGKSVGLVLTAQADGTWAPQSMTGVIERVSTNWNANEVLDVELITVGPGIDVNSTLGANRAHLQLVWGTSGSGGAVARANHTHPPTLKGRFLFDKAAAVIGAGTSTLVNQTVAGLISSVVYDVDITGKLEGVNTNSSGRLFLRSQIGGNPSQSVSRGFSGGVWSEVSIDGTQMSITGVTSLQLQFWAEYQSGDPTALYTGSLVYRISPRGGTT